VPGHRVDLFATLSRTLVVGGIQGCSPALLDAIRPHSEASIVTPDDCSDQGSDR
jgi:hypothetical protein